MQGKKYIKEHALFCGVGWDWTLKYPLYTVLFVTEIRAFAEYGLQLHKTDT
jgi:hypothetical protein